MSSKWPPPDPVFTPFWRRFGDERARDWEETAALWAEVRAAFCASPWAAEHAADGVARRVLAEIGQYVDVPADGPLYHALEVCVTGILAREKGLFSFPEIEGSAARSAAQLVELRRTLRAKEQFLAKADEAMSLLVRDAAWACALALTAAEAIVAPDGAAFTVPLIEAVDDATGLVARFIGAVEQEDAIDAGLFVFLRRTFYENTCAVSGVLPDTELRKPLQLAERSTLPPRELAEAYLRGTPFLDLVMTPVPLSVPFSVRFEHTHILAGSGHGKTQTLQHLILSDLQRDNPPALVIIDGQGEMIDKLSRLALFQGRDDPLIIDPRDTPALNLFDVNFDRLSQYGPMYKEQILNGVIELYDYLFGSLLGAELTQKQSVIFRYLARLMLTIPGATIHTLIELLGDEKPYQKYIERLPAGARLFFETEFPHKSFADTKRQIQRRLWGILENPTFEKMMTARETRVDMFGALQGGRVVLVNTAKDFLKAERSSFLGRFFIALTLQAVLERAAVPEAQRHPAFLYVDEAADYFDDNIDDLLTQARKYRLGVVFAHQYLDQLANGLRSSIASNTSIKFAGGVSDRDARSLAPDMRTTPTFIMEQRKKARGTQFACYVRNTTAHALGVTVPFGSLEREDTLDDECYGFLRDRNRWEVCGDDEEAVAAELARLTARETPDDAAVPPADVPGSQRAEAVPASAPVRSDPDDIDTAAGSW